MCAVDFLFQILGSLPEPYDKFSSVCLGHESVYGEELSVPIENEIG